MAANGTPVTHPGKATRITRPQKRYDTFNTAAPVLRPSIMRLSVPGYQRNGKRTRHGDCLRFGTLNCRTLANDTAIEQLLTANRKANIDILALQETKSRKTSCDKTKNGELLILGEKVNGKNIGGIGFLINESVQSAVDSFEIVNARLGILRLDFGNKGKIALINVYAPTATANEENLDDFYRMLEDTIRREKAYYIYVLGDFNAIVGKSDLATARHGKYGLGSRNENGERLIDLLDARKLYHGNSLFEKPDQRRWTWKSANGATTNEIDHILTNRKWTLLDVAVLPSFDIGSDHRLVRAKKSASTARPVYDAATLEKNISEYKWSHNDDPTIDYKNLCDGLIRCAEPAARSTSSLPPRIDQKAKEMLRKRGEIKRDPASTHLERLTIDKACRIAVETSLANRRKNALLLTAEKHQSIRKKKFELIDLTTVMTALKDKCSVAVPRSAAPPAEEEPPIIEEEVAHAIRRLKNGTAAGPDNISTEILKSGGDALNRLLAKRFSTYLKNNEIPEQWKIIVNRLEKKLDDFQPPSQAGFRRNFCCLDHIHTLTQVVEHYRKAFDSVEINAILNSLVAAGIPTKYIDLIEKVQRGNVDYNPTAFDKRDTISPKLFSTALEDAMRQLGWDTNRDWEDGNVIKGINIDGKILTNLRFADDIVLFANNTSDLSSMLNDLDAWMRNRFCDQGNVTLEGRDLLEVNSYVYLGREVNMTNDLKTRDSKTPTSWMGRLKDPKLRAHIFEASVIPAISYATEVWPDTKNTTTALRTSYRALERALLGTTRFEQWKKEQTSTDLRQRSQIQDLEEHIQRGKHRWGGHVIRRQDDRWSTRTTHWIPRNIKRPLGRPPTRWTDYFRKNISQPGRHWMTVAQDRAAWRTCGPR
ncbi:unnamed protein product [Caenorhabditis auriculariae]|uniref:Reverse transcriptase domain-containing protein n=1 Tax=Caenorhabditis auriculariae TaxID=2777116 RepID=A0A8S1HFY0_9PELO|nr:unnamed protein product [Caenorhabditis auriculariae]